MSHLLDNAVHGEVFCEVPPGAETMPAAGMCTYLDPNHHRRWPRMMRHLSLESKPLLVNQQLTVQSIAMHLGGSQCCCI